MPELSGQCRCGSVRYRVHGDVLNAGHCHCESCRRTTSSPVTTYFTAHRSAVTLTGDSLRHYASSPGVERSFCGTCGSPMSYTGKTRPDEIDLFVATLDAGQSVEIKEHWYWGERVPWLHVEDDLPKED